MSVQINSHVILSHIDSPARILIWPANQVLMCSVPFAFGMVTEHLGIGVGMSIIAAFSWKILHKKFGKGKMRALLYWNLPTASRLIKQGVPPSYIRFWVK